MTDSSSDPQPVHLSKITRRNALKATVGPFAAAALGARVSLAQNSKPNIVFLMADDLGYADLSSYGRRDYQTPNIDRLADEGVKFLQSYANSAVCSATRVALMTGRYQYRLEVGLQEPLSSAAAGLGLPPEHPTIPSLLRDAGYGTTLIGKWHLGWLPDFGPMKSGYDHFWGFRGHSLDYFTHKMGPADSDTADLWDDDAEIEVAGYLTDLLGERAVKVIGDYAEAGQPFYLSVHFNAPHWPWEGPMDQAESQRLRTLSQFDAGTLKTYGEMVTAMDAQVGNILAKIEEAGIADNTIVIFTSDNGGERFSDTWPFTGKKQELLEGGLRIPTLVRWPGHIAAGSETDQVAMTMDWLPTVVAAGGGSVDAAYPPDGIDLLPVLTGESRPVERTVFWRYNANAQRAMRDGDMKLLQIRENTFLFNVVDDPLERANLKSRQPEVYSRLVQAYENWDAQMLPDSFHNGGGFNASQMADHFGNEVPQRPAAAKPKPGAAKPKLQE